MTRSQRPSNFSVGTLRALSDTQVGFGILCLILGVTDIIITSLRAEKCSEYYLLSSKLQDKSPWSDPASLMFRSPAPSYSQHAYACYLLYYKIWLSTPSLLCGIVFSMAGVVGAGAARSFNSPSQDCMKRTFLTLSLLNAIVFAPILFALGVWKAFDLFLSTEEEHQWWMQRAVIAIALGTVGLAEWVISIVSTSASCCYVSPHSMHSREGSGPSLGGQVGHNVNSPIYHRDHRDKAKLLDNADYYADC